MQAFTIADLLTYRKCPKAMYLQRKSGAAPVYYPADIDKLWREVEWDWYQNGQDVLYWHWSPEYGWEMNFPVEGYNEGLVMYILGASSPTHPITADAYHKGWARNGGIISDNEKYGLPLVLRHNGAEEYGGPLFWSHYSFFGLNPKGLKDRYADYCELNRNHALISSMIM